MGTRRMRQLTSDFSKKLENLQAAYYLRFAFYDFSQILKRREPPRNAERDHGSRLGIG